MAKLSIERQLDKIPNTSGIYKFIDKSGKLLYVGKANNLRTRVRSYFTQIHDDRPHIIPMIEQIEKIEVTETENEIEALVLESALIKENQPHYNIMLKDDKSYAWIYINTRDELPTVSILRSINLKDYKKGRLFGPYPNSRATRQIFRYIRQIHPFCTCDSPSEPCLYYRMKLCNNPKFGDHTLSQYQQSIEGVIKFLEGSKRNHIKELRKQMDQLSQDRDYENAAILRDKIYDLEHLGEDIPYYQSESDFIIQKKTQNHKIIQKYQKDFAIPLPERIECYDISNLQGDHAYGSMTVAIDGELRPDQYRVFKIRKGKTPDDFEMLNEVISRRIKHLSISDDVSLSNKPNLILIDGGKGQISAVAEEIPTEITLMGISKGRSLRKRGKRKKDMFWLYREDSTEQVFTKEPRLLVVLRDEAHRFALKHHRIARAKGMKGSLLDRVEGVGPKIKKKLMKKFGSVANMHGLSIDELNEVVSNRSTSLKLHDALKGSTNTKKQSKTK